MKKNKQWYCRDWYYCSHRLVFSERKIIVRPTWILAAFFCGWGATLGFICSLILCSELKMPRYGELIFCGMVMLFVCGFLSYLFLRSYPEIDLEKGVFYPYGKKKRIFGKTPVVLPLKNVSAIELSHHSSCFSKHHFECFTLQLIVPRGQRNYHYMLLNHGDYSTFMMDAEKLSKALDLPLPDAGLEDFNNKRIRKFAPLALLIYPVIFFIIAKEISCAIQQKDMFLFICGVLIMPVMVFSLINTVKAFKGKN